MVKSGESNKCRLPRLNIQDLFQTLKSNETLKNRTPRLILMNSEVLNRAQTLRGPKIISPCRYNSSPVYAQKQFFYRAGIAENDIKLLIFKVASKGTMQRSFKPYNHAGALFQQKTQHKQGICCLTRRCGERKYHFIFSERFQVCTTTAPTTCQRSCTSIQPQ